MLYCVVCSIGMDDVLIVLVVVIILLGTAMSTAMFDTVLKELGGLISENDLHVSQVAT